jgi:MYXO-CTERM domain-containing protein
MHLRRPIVARRLGRLLPFASFASFASFAATAGLTASAHAAPAIPRVTRTATSTAVVPRDGKAWIHIGARAAGRVAPRTSLADLESAARSELAAVTGTPAASTRALVRTAVDHFGDGDAVVRFEQTHAGLPVIGRGATVRLSNDPARVVTTLDLETELPASTAPQLDATSAARAAARFSPLTPSSNDAHLVVWPTHGGARLAWIVLPRAPGLPTAPRVVVDGADGSVLEARDLVVFAKAQMYRTNPVKSANLELFDLPMETTGKTLTNDFLQAVNCIDKKASKPVNFFGFNQNMHVCDLDQIVTADDAGDFFAQPADEPGSAASKSDAFSELSIYFHASKAYAYFRDLQGDPTAQVADDKPLRLVANLQLPPGVSQGNFSSAGDVNKPLEPFQNAFFAPAAGGLGDVFAQLYDYKGGALWFGQGPNRDYAYDGDVVYHEFGHAVVDHTIKLGAWSVDARGIIDAPGAMNEGLADYFSSAIAGDPNVGEYASKDISQNLDVIRSLANQDSCPTSLVGEVHFDSTFFSGGLWQARSALGSEADRKKLDAGIYKAMRSNPGRSDIGFEDAVKLFLATLQVDFPAGATALETVMKERGVLPGCERIRTFDGKAIRAGDARIGFSAPGAASVGLQGTAPGILQFRAKIPANTAQVTFSFTARESGGGGGGGLGGGGGAPFTPVVLAKFGAAISWKDGKSGLVNDADAFKKVAVAEAAVSATFDVPPSDTDAETDVYFQVANEGDDSGSYDAIEIAAVPGGAAPAEAAASQAPATTQTTTSCACTSAGQSAAGTAAVPGGLGFLAAAASVAMRRRRRV